MNRKAYSIADLDEDAEIVVEYIQREEEPADYNATRGGAPMPAYRALKRAFVVLFGQEIEIPLRNLPTCFYEKLDVH